MAITVVQAASNNNFSSSNLDITVTLTSITAGNALIVWAQSGYGIQPTYVGSTATDGGSDTFTFLQQINDAANGQYGGLWFCNSSVGGFTTVTTKFSNFTSGDGFGTMTVYEVSGLAAGASDTGATNLVAGGSGSSATNGDTAGSFTPSQSGELVIGCFFNDSGGGTTWTAGTSPNVFTIPSGGSIQLGGGVNPHAIEYVIYNSTSAINPTVTLGGTGGYIAISWGFKPATGTASTFEDDSFVQFQPPAFDAIVSVW